MSGLKPPFDKFPEQCFVLSMELLTSMTREEVLATYADMEKLNLAKPPYQKFDIIVPNQGFLIDTRIEGEEAHVMEQFKDSVIMRLRVDMDAMRCKWLITNQGETLSLVGVLMAGTEYTPEQLDKNLQSLQKSATELIQLLVVLLATKNIVKEKAECKMVRLGIGTKQRNRYTTTIRIGEVTESVASGHHTGITLRPHLRRGHIRNQHWGPKNERVKRIFVEPTFVNADDEWIGARTAYNVSMGGKRHEHHSH